LLNDARKKSPSLLYELVVNNHSAADRADAKHPADKEIRSYYKE
jgi:hypothetical protein